MHVPKKPPALAVGSITKIAQLGCGYWGPNLLRNFSAQADCHVKWVAEEDPKRRDYVEANYPKTQTTPHWQETINDPEVDAVVIATPAFTHYALGKACLEVGKHLFVEKPLAMCVPEAQQFSFWRLEGGNSPKKLEKYPLDKMK